MSKIRVRAIARKFDNGFLFLPATQADKRVINEFCSEAENRYITLEASLKKSSKTFDQVKTVWALISILFEAAWHRQPNKQEADNIYEGLLIDYADKEDDLRHPGQKIPISLSRMSSEQAVRFIQSIINELSLIPNMADKLECDVKEIFEEFHRFKNSLITDPVDYDKHGNLLTTEQWLKVNTCSFASGLRENLEIAHIVSKGSAPQFRDCVWNFMLLTHEEHIEIQHKKGFSELLAIFPHLKGRYDRALSMAHKLNNMTDPEPEEKTDIFKEIPELIF